MQINANVNVQNSNGKIALMTAYIDNNKDIVSMLLKAGADHNIAIRGCTPLKSYRQLS